jgi:hypothetical protein
MAIKVKTLSPSNKGRSGISGSVTTYVIMDRVERNLKPYRRGDFTGQEADVSELATKREHDEFG